MVLAFGFQTFLAQPDWGGVAIGLLTPQFDGVDSLLFANRDLKCYGHATRYLLTPFVNAKSYYWP